MQCHHLSVSSLSFDSTVESGILQQSTTVTGCGITRATTECRSKLDNQHKVGDQHPNNLEINTKILWLGLRIHLVCFWYHGENQIKLRSSRSRSNDQDWLFLLIISLPYIGSASNCVHVINHQEDFLLKWNFVFPFQTICIMTLISRHLNTHPVFAVSCLT